MTNNEAFKKFIAMNSNIPDGVIKHEITPVVKEGHAFAVQNGMAGFLISQAAESYRETLRLAGVPEVDIEKNVTGFVSSVDPLKLETAAHIQRPSLREKLEKCIPQIPLAEGEITLIQSDVCNLIDD